MEEDDVQVFLEVELCGEVEEVEKDEEGEGGEGGEEV